MPAACGPPGAVLQVPLREYIDEQYRESSFQEGRLMVMLEAKSLSLRVPDRAGRPLFGGGAEGDSLVFISHDLSVVRALCDRVLVMRNDEVVESGPCAELFANPAHEYTRGLLDAIPLPEVDRGWADRGRIDPAAAENAE